jgi:flavorubredoxin
MMSVTNLQSGTRIDEVADNIFRIHTPIPPSIIPGGFSFNQYLITDDEPLLFHTGPRRLFDLTAEAVSHILPMESLKYIGLSHFEADECGALNDFLARAPNAVPLCGKIAGMVSINDVADRAPRMLADQEAFPIGKHTLKWFDAPHLPHAWECGFLMDITAETLLCGDLFTQGGVNMPPLVTTDILGPSEGFRKKLDYFSHTKNARAMLEKLSTTSPSTLACMHGSAWQGDGANLLHALGTELEKDNAQQPNEASTTQI